MKKLLFVDDEPRVLQGLQRQLRLMREEWQMDFVESGPKALEFLATSPVDVLVTDMMMPGMDGAQLLTEVMRRCPNTVRLVLSGHADREAVLRLVGPAHQYLSKPCDADELRNAIARALAMRELLASEPLKRLACRIDRLPSLPASHAQLTDELRKPDPSVDRVAAIISKDLGMTTKILQLVNSAFFGLSQPASNVGEAVMYLGLTTIRSLVLSCQVFSQFDQETIEAFPIDGIAQHCWMTGVIARRLAEVEQRDPKISDQCFLAGLLHDLGYLILAAGLPEQYAQVLQAAHDSNRPVWEVEQAELNASHAEVGAYLLGLWGLPTPVIEAVALHHRPAAAVFKGFSPVIAVHVADVLAHRLEPSRPEQAGIEVDLPLLAAFGLDGIEFLGAVRKTAPDTIRIMLTGNADLEGAIRVVNQGHIFRFLTKPCPPDMLTLALQDAQAQYKLVTAEKELLNKTLNGSIKLLTDILSMVESQSFGRAQMLRNAITTLTARLYVENAWEIHLAVMLASIGYVTIPPETLVKSRAGQPLSSVEDQMIERLPETTARLLANIPRLEGVARIVQYQHKHFDGSGFPADNMAGDSIPLGSRLLKILTDMADLQSGGLPQGKALEKMQALSGRYDPALLAAVRTCAEGGQVGAVNVSQLSLPLRLTELLPGMVLRSNVETRDGTLILSVGHHLSEMTLEKLRNFERVAGINEPILVENTGTVG